MNEFQKAQLCLGFIALGCAFAWDYWNKKNRSAIKKQKYRVSAEYQMLCLDIKQKILTFSCVTI